MSDSYLPLSSRMRACLLGFFAASRHPCHTVSHTLAHYNLERRRNRRCALARKEGARAVRGVGTFERKTQGSNFVNTEIHTTL